MVQDMCSILCRCIVVSQGLGACLASAWGLVHFSDDLMVGHVWVIRCANARAARAYPIHSEFNPILIHVRVIKAIATQSKTGLFYERVANVLLRLWHSMAFSCTVILSTHSLGGCQETWLVTGRKPQTTCNGKLAARHLSSPTSSLSEEIPGNPI